MSVQQIFGALGSPGSSTGLPQLCLAFSSLILFQEMYNAFQQCLVMSVMLFLLQIFHHPQQSLKLGKKVQKSCNSECRQIILVGLFDNVYTLLDILQISVSGTSNLHVHNAQLASYY